jgi:hypothetical protein
MQITEINKRKFAPASESQKVEVAERMKKLRKEGEKMIKGMFEFVDAQGGWLDFSYRFFPGDPIRTVKINHGEVVDIPMILAKHLNNVYKKVRIPPQNADQGKSSVTKISRTRFTPMDMLTEDLIRVGH